MARIKRPKVKKSTAPARVSPQLNAIIQKTQQLHQAGHTMQALQLLSENEASNPNEHIILFHMAAFLQNIGRNTDAIAYCERALKQQPRHLMTLKVYGAALIDLNQSERAIPALQKAWSIKQSDPQILRLLVHACFAQDRHQDGIALLEKYNKTTDHDDLLQLAVTGYHHRQREQEAIDLIQTALDKKSDAETLTLMAQAQANNGDYSAEFDYARRAYDLAPDNIKVISDYALALEHQGQHDQAITVLDQCIHTHPTHELVFQINKATLLKNTHQLPEAKACLQRALRLHPNSAEANYALGQVNQLAGNYAESWPQLEWHWHVPGRAKFRPTQDLPIWYGDESLNDKTILIYEDQGVGDTLLFCRFLPVIKQHYPNSRIILMVEGKMAEIFERSFPCVDDVMVKQASGEKTIKADYTCAISTLPMAFKTTLQTLPTCPPITNKQKLTYKQSPDDIIIGITWRTVSITAGEKRSVTLRDFAPLVALPNVKLLNLQYGDTLQEREACGFDILHDETIDPYLDMQGHLDQISACDLVISIDNTTVHAAGTLGVPVWTLLPYECYWRVFHHDQNATPWYPSMRLFRQDETRDYTHVFARIQTVLTQWLDGDQTCLSAPPYIFPETSNKAKGKNALLLNDTSDWYHWGCNATSGAIIQNLQDKGYQVISAPFLEVGNTSMRPPTLADFDNRQFLSDYMFTQPSLFEKIRNCDHLVINGEGTIHSTSPNAVRLLYLAYIAKTFFQKTVHIINHACFPQSSMTIDDPNIVAYYRKAYLMVDDVVVRDPISHGLLNQLEIPNRLGFDSLPLAARHWLDTHAGERPRRKTVILAGSSKFSPQSGPALKRMVDLIQEAGYDIAMLSGSALHESNDDLEFLQTLKTATGEDTPMIKAESLDAWFDHLYHAPLLISGRFHYTIAAAALGTSFLAFEGNTPKLHALSAFLDAPEPLAYDDPNLGPSLSLKTMKTLENLTPQTALHGEKLNEMCRLAEENYTQL